MVSLNPTLLIELGLFLLFVWGTHRFVIRPVLRVMDERDARLAQDEHSASEDNAEAHRLEEHHQVEIAKALRDAHQKTERTRRGAREQHGDTLAVRRKQADAEVEAARGALLQEVEAERAKYATLTPDLADAMGRQLGLGGRES